MACIVLPSDKGAAGALRPVALDGSETCVSIIIQFLTEFAVNLVREASMEDTPLVDTNDLVYFEVRKLSEYGLV